MIRTFNLNMNNKKGNFDSIYDLFSISSVLVLDLSLFSYSNFLVNIYDCIPLSLTLQIQVAIPVVSTVRVLVTFTKFEEMQHENADEFESAPSSPTSSDQENPEEEHSSSWFGWIKTPSRSSTTSAESSSKIFDDQDLFAIPSGYKWVTIEDKLKKRGLE